MYTEYKESRLTICITCKKIQTKKHEKAQTRHQKDCECLPAPVVQTWFEQKWEWAQ
jgi:hypothetical protein